jgi:hypothetical protein
VICESSLEEDTSSLKTTSLVFQMTKQGVGGLISTVECVVCSYGVEISETLLERDKRDE